MEKIFLAALQTIPGIGAAHLRNLVRKFGSGERAWKADAAKVRQSGCLEQVAYEKFVAHRHEIDIELFMEELRQKKIGLCSITEEAYPESLRNIYNPPMLLFYRGNFSFTEKRIAIVGARRATAYGKSVAEQIASSLAAVGVEVVSGAARGIDTAAHVGALKKGRTIAVLGCGIDVTYPRENQKLLDQIAEAGLILSEYAPGVQAHPAYFPARNRIISGISSGVVVVEAALKSGSLITAELALSEGRDVFAVPGSIYSELSKGCHRLIQQGAHLTENARDVLEECGWEASQAEKQEKATLSADECAVYEVLRYDQPLPIDEIILKTRRNASNVAFLLLQMELRGIVKEYTPRCYVRVTEEDIL